MAFELKEGEEILADVGANLFRGIEGVGGLMKITNRRVLFEAHAINIQKQPAEISFEHIAEVRERNTMGFIPNGILILTNSGIKYKFTVWGRKRLIGLIQSHLSKT